MIKTLKKLTVSIFLLVLIIFIAFLWAMSLGYKFLGYWPTKGTAKLWNLGELAIKWVDNE